MEHWEMGLIDQDQVDSRGRRWRRFCTSGYEYQVNMSVLEPYLQVLSHGGQRSHHVLLHVRPFTGRQNHIF